VPSREKLIEREYARFQQISGLSKIKARLSPPPAPPPAPTGQTTLTNASGARTRPMSPRDRAVARLKEGR
jgi:hypothetical protein